jgi:large subunit ribosomal protein L31
MKKTIHPLYYKVQFICNCGFKLETQSTVQEDIHIEICSQCHPFYTGKQKLIDTEGRIVNFERKFSKYNIKPK